MTEELLRALLVEIHGSPSASVPVFDIDQKTVTRGGHTSSDSSVAESQKTLDLDFSGGFKKLDVMEELGLDPLDLGNLVLLRPKLREMLVSDKTLPEPLIGSLNDK